MTDQSGRFYRFSEHYSDDAPAAVLTPAQREYLTGQKEPSDASERAIRHRIRKRIEPAMLDFELLARNYPEEELDKIRVDEGDQLLPKNGLAAWVYLIQPDYGNERISKDDQIRRAGEWTEHSVKNGIQLVLGEREDILADIDVSVEIDRKENLEEVAERPLSELSRSTLDTLLTTGHITPEEYGTEIERRLS